MPDPNPTPSSFITQRSKLLQQYDTLGSSYEAKTKPYKSTVQAILPVVDFFPATATMGHAVLRANSILLWFAYKIGDSVPFGPAGTVRNAVESDTNLSKPRQTNGVEDFVIEGISASARSQRVDYPATNYTGTDTDAISAYLGKTVMYDPAALAMPPQQCSPFNLEGAVYEAIKPHIAVEFEWDRRRVEKIGTLDEIPEGGAKSFLRASGDPRTDNRFRIPEGYLWRREGLPDSEFVVRGTVAEAVVIPISLVAIAAGAGNANKPNNLYIDITVRLHGLAVALPSGN
jgi:hypothetical protein